MKTSRALDVIRSLDVFVPQMTFWSRHMELFALRMGYEFALV